MKKSRVSFLLVLLVVGVSVCWGDYYYCDTGKKSIGGSRDIPIGKPMEFLQFTGSKDGLLMYVERDPDNILISGVTYSQYRGLAKEAHDVYLIRKELQYDPERITRKLHILTPDGKDKYVIPIPDKHGGQYEHGSFPNDSFVQFELIPRYGDGSPMILRIFNLKTGQIFTLIHTDRFVLGDPEYSPVYSPDEKHFAVAIYDRATSLPLLLVDGTMMLPYHDAEPPVPFVSPEEYDKRVERFTKRSSDYRGFVLGGCSWSSDGRYLFFVQPKGYRDAPEKLAASEPSLLILDTEKAAAGKDYRDYCLRIPFQMPEEIQKKVESIGDRPRRLAPKLLENENVMEISKPWNSDIHFRIPLPAGWRNADTIRAALEKAKALTPVPPTSPE